MPENRADSGVDKDVNVSVDVRSPSELEEITSGTTESTDGTARNDVVVTSGVVQNVTDVDHVEDDDTVRRLQQLAKQFSSQVIQRTINYYVYL